MHEILPSYLHLLAYLHFKPNYLKKVPSLYQTVLRCSYHTTNKKPHEYGVSAIY